MADLNSFSDNPKKVTQELTKKFFDNYFVNCYGGLVQFVDGCDAGKRSGPS